MSAGAGKIITFYSYKGGTGRSMALANTAWILASRGKRVLMIDWDLEAPGLHRYFHPFIKDKNLTSTEGLIDFVMRFEDGAVRPAPGTDGGTANQDASAWYLPLAKLDRYVLPLACPFPGEGALDLMPAGKQDQSYSARVNSFNWPGFYDRLGGGVFLEAVKREMKQHYDYVLIDSRTGVSDTAGICTVQMPDIVVVCFTFNIQSIEGVAAVAGSIRSQRSRAGSAAQGGGLRIFPVPMRVERTGDKDRLERAREFAQSALSGFLDHVGDTQGRYWGQVDVPYDPFYAFQEILATVADLPGVRDSVLTSFEQLTSFLTDGEISELAPLQKETRDTIKALFLRGASPRDVASVIAGKPELQELCETAITAQKSWLESQQDNKYLLDDGMVVKLEQAVELLIALLEDQEFRAFWDKTRAYRRQRRLARASLVQLGIAATLIAALSLVAILKARQLIPAPVKYYAFMFVAGMLGTIVDSILSLDSRVNGAQRNVTLRVNTALVSLLGGGLAGTVAGLLLQSYNVTTALPEVGATAFLAAALAGYASRVLIPDTIARIAAVDKRPLVRVLKD
jgi:MinD-like ATPase involved in chromosome partitioning or flagellar assembly